MAAVMFAGCLAQPSRATDIPTDTAVLRALDKVSARVSTLRAPVDRPVNFGRLEIVVRRCITRPPEETPESAAFLEIVKAAADGTRQPVFRGWMFASSPDLAAMEDAIYDIWVLSCENSTAASSSGSNGP
ncbi:MAG: DUF2155 domain-containing protein [Rhodospirillaceae bacterium]|nr:DUF2155 domain-containing protein [Rhodospirillaceae bacterium]